MDDTWDVIVIGSGLGGMAVASILSQHAERRVLVLERHHQAGGLTQVFRRRGYAWDVGLHYVGGMGEGQPGRALMDFFTGGRTRWHSLGDPYDTFVYPDLRFDVPVGGARYVNRLVERFPEEADGLRAYFRDLQTAAEWMGMEMAQQALPTPGGGRQVALRTTAEVLEAHIGDPKLRALLCSQWEDYGLSPEESGFGIHALVTSSYFDGAFYPEGGAKQIGRGMEAVLKEHGGVVRVNRAVKEILVEEGRAVGVRAVVRHGELEGEEEVYRAPVVISDAGAVPTYLQLVPESVPLPFREELGTFRHGHSAVVAYLGLRRDPREMPWSSTGQNLWMFDGYDHARMRRDSVSVLEGRPNRAVVFFSSMHDPTATKHTLQILSGVDYEAFTSWKGSYWHHRGQDYEVVKRRVADGLIDYVEAELPGLREEIEVVEVSTPLTVEHFTAHPFGAYYGVPAVPERYGRPWARVETPLEGLYLTGADVASLGIQGVAMSGVVTAGKVLGSLDFMQNMQPLKSANVRSTQR